MMLAAAPRANTGSLATSMARTIAPHVRMVFISGLPRLHAKLHASSHERSMVDPRRRTMTEARNFANAHQVDRHTDRIEPDAATRARSDLKSPRRMSGSRRRHSRSGGPRRCVGRLRGRSIAAGAATRRRRHVNFARRSDHFDALARRILRRDLLVLDTRRRDHHGLRHHHGAILRRRPVRDDRARRHHHGLLDRAVLRWNDLPLIAGRARLRRHIAIIASRRRRARDGQGRDCGHGNQQSSMDS